MNSAHDISRLFQLLIFSLLLAFLSACSSPKLTNDGHQAENHEDHAGHHHEEHGEEIMLTSIQAEKVGIQYGQMALRPVSKNLIVNGVVALMPQKQAQASSLLAGRIEQIRVQPGDFVKKGTQLVLIKNPDLIDLQQALQEVKASLLYLDQEYERRQTLLADSVIALDAFQQIEAERQQALARQRGLKAKLQAYGLDPTSESLGDEIWVCAPLAGYVDEVLVSMGASIDAMQPLVMLLQSDAAHIELKVFEQDVDKVHQGQAISFSLNSKPQQSHQASVFAIDKMLEISDRSLRVFARPTEKINMLLPGMYLTAAISLGTSEQLCLPMTAIARDKTLAYIFVKEHEMENEIHFQQVEVLLGQADRNFVVVEALEELASDAEVVIEGAFYLLAQSKKGEAAPGHSH